MNERMIELLNEANKTAGFTFSMEQAKPVHELMEKLAEMIIAECAAIAWFAEQYDMGDDKPISKQITEHFGVKYERQN